MSKELNVRWGWLKGMYIYTIIGAGGFGLGIIFVPNEMGTMFRMLNTPMPSQDPIVLGITGSVYLSFALLALPQNLWVHESSKSMQHPDIDW